MHDVTHAIMFHHFHDCDHPPGQGSLGADDFAQMLDWLGERYNLLSAADYQQKAINHELSPRDICLSFDDALLCQYEIAVPVLDRRGIGAFFFIYSAPLNGEPEYLEIFRYFRSVAYSDVEAFYADFFAQCHAVHADLMQQAQDQYDPATYLSAFPFYTPNDKLFRYLRDVALGKQKYEQLMVLLMGRKGFDVPAIMPRLWMKEDHLRRLCEAGHIIGLHSYSHPTTMHTLPADQQTMEYTRNIEHLQSVLNKPVTAMSHPCGNYNDDTLLVLRELGIEIGFRSSMSRTEISSLLEIPREDHANVFREMRR